MRTSSPLGWERGQQQACPAVTAGFYLSLLAVLAVLQSVNADLGLIAFLPDWLESLPIPLLPGLITYVSGCKAKHTARPTFRRTSSVHAVRQPAVLRTVPESREGTVDMEPASSPSRCPCRTDSSSTPPSQTTGRQSNSC
ncbi:hypothetical protein [Nonomuraea sp. NPDC049784]|uniref:hypothetical protein n=1 Tax=Nonomuraea sp. NPDC049784 TaxID=3154361 RepID=UPI0033F06D44